MEGGDGGGAGLRFLLRFDPEKPGLDRTLLGVSLSALLTRLLGWSKDGGEGPWRSWGRKLPSAAPGTLPCPPPRLPRRFRFASRRCTRLNSARAALRRRRHSSGGGGGGLCRRRIQVRDSSAPFASFA